MKYNERLQLYAAQIGAATLRHDFHRPLDNIGMEADNLLQVIGKGQSIGLPSTTKENIIIFCEKISCLSSKISNLTRHFGQKLRSISEFQAEYDFQNLHKNVNPLFSDLNEHAQNLSNFLKQSQISDIRTIGQKIAFDVDQIQRTYSGLTYLFRIGSVDLDNFSPVNIAQLSAVISRSIAKQDRFGHIENINVSGEAIIEGIRSQLTLIFQNLITNAVKFTAYTNDPAISIHIRTDHFENIRVRFKSHLSQYNAQGHWMECHVVDNGPGVQPEDKNNIFQMYFTRNDNALNPDGTGAGLAIAKIVSLMHGGFLFLNSNDDYTDFTLILPEKRKDGLSINVLAKQELSL